jgi:hypothetical protein
MKAFLQPVKFFLMVKSKFALTPYIQYEKQHKQFFAFSAGHGVGNPLPHRVRHLRKNTPRRGRCAVTKIRNGAWSDAPCAGGRSYPKSANVCSPDVGARAAAPRQDTANGLGSDRAFGADFGKKMESRSERSKNATPRPAKLPGALCGGKLWSAKQLLRSSPKPGDLSRIRRARQNEHEKKLVIVALTANAIVGNDKMFLTR